jgi:hypothetical protein
MRMLKWSVAVLLLLIVVLLQLEASAQQVPPHKPGTICQTPRFWCWAQPAGSPGASCTCPSPAGPVTGSLV